MALRVIDQYAAHHLRGHSHEVCAVLPVDLFLIGQPQISLVDERRGLKGVILALSPEIASGDGSQFVIHNRYQLV